MSATCWCWESLEQTRRPTGPKIGFDRTAVQSPAWAHSDASWQPLSAPGRREHVEGIALSHFTVCHFLRRAAPDPSRDPDTHTGSVPTDVEEVVKQLMPRAEGRGRVKKRCEGQRDGKALKRFQQVGLRWILSCEQCPQICCCSRSQNFVGELP